MKSQEKTPVVFRKWSDGEIIALFPTIPDTPQFCSSYMHVGQHSGAHYSGVIQSTEPATPQEYADLLAELESIGYNLDIRSRKPTHS